MAHIIYTLIIYTLLGFHGRIAKGCFFFRNPIKPANTNNNTPRRAAILRGGRLFWPPSISGGTSRGDMCSRIGSDFDSRRADMTSVKDSG